MTPSCRDGARATIVTAKNFEYQEYDASWVKFLTRQRGLGPYHHRIERLALILYAGGPVVGDELTEQLARIGAGPGGRG